MTTICKQWQWFIFNKLLEYNLLPSISNWNKIQINFIKFIYRGFMLLLSSYFDFSVCNNIPGRNTLSTIEYLIKRDRKMN